MKPPSLRRHNHWHERLLLSDGFIIFAGWLMVVALPYVSFWPWLTLWHPDHGQVVALWATSLAYGVTQVIFLKIRALYPGGRMVEFIVPTIVVSYGMFALLSLVLHLPVSRYLLLSSCVCAVIWMLCQHLLTAKYLRLKLAVVPGGRYTTEILTLAHAHPLTTLSLKGVRYDGVVADFEYCDTETQRFLTQCVLTRTAVYDARDVYESLTGRVKIHRMTENRMGTMLPSPFYEMVKRCLDVVVVVATLPLTVLVGVVVALMIKLESPGPIIYTQTRTGQGGRPFTIYKFRSMRFDRDESAQFAHVADPRITRVGRVIRKLRIDELPQFFNVLKGDMSLIGPRPEQAGFVAEYEEKIPFYSYRHIVKPGITGWAQVRHGYTASADETQVKIEHDFYYIKHYSLSLDLIIMLLTLRIMVSGFGAR